ncbi:MAG: heavy-metal-associated domain-containing protein [Prevotella sp.]|nr:heavy-metal-associated domain-containing protein [Prevotella sp.]
MKKYVLMLCCLTTSLCLQAKDIKTVVVTTQPQMHCENCEKKIKGNLRFEKGVKKIDTNVKEQRVTITYDAEKTTPTVLIKSFQKFGYKATEVEAKKPAKKPADGQTGATEQVK